MIPIAKSPPKKISSLSMTRDPPSPIKNMRHARSNGQDSKIRVKFNESSKCNFRTSR